ncbi:MAG: PIN domain-containing protein [Actinomycetes bacterium]
MAGVVVFDANVLIALCLTTDAHHTWALDVFRFTQGSNLMVSAMTYSEFLIRPKREGVLQQMLNGIEQLGLEITPIDVHNALALTDVRARTNLRMPDAVVLQTAIEHSGSVATTDKRLASAARELNIPVYQP